MSKYVVNEIKIKRDMWLTTNAAYNLELLRTFF